MNKKVLLMILDGWGIAENPEVSAIDKANTPFVDSLYGKYPNSKLEASGLAVGLPEGQMGNSEVGHMNIGAGRTVYQMFTRISKDINEGQLASNEELLKAYTYAKQEGKKVHLMGLLSDGGIHSHIDHLKGLVKVAADQGLEDVFVHAFTDGRDTDPYNGKNYLADLEAYLQTTTGKIASVVGRYYAMDRDKRWERVKLAYDLMVKGIGTETTDIAAAMQQSYDAEVTDEFIMPIVATNETGNPIATMEEGDVVICFNFRTDRGREITQVLTQEAISDYGLKPLDLYYVTMTQYDETYQGVKILYSNEDLTQTLGEVLEQQGKTQLRIAETEKYPHVTFFFSGGRELEFKGEDRIMCQSPKVATYDLQPEMSAADIRDGVVNKMDMDQPDFICLNFANPDMVGHTGVFEAAMKACETVDQCAEAVVNTALKHDYATIIIADHGNSDCMVNPDGSVNTAHTTALVPCILVDDNYSESIKNGKLGDLAPTILELMGISKPVEMSGNSLL